MNFSKISGWLLLVILSICISACSSDSDKEDSPSSPTGSSNLIGYWEYIDLDKNDEGFFEFKGDNVLTEYSNSDNSLEIENFHYYLDSSTNKLLIWYGGDDYEVYQLSSSTNTSLTIAYCDCEAELWEEFGDWNNFDVKAAKKVIDFVNKNNYRSIPVYRLTRSSKSELDKWIKDNE